MGDVERLQHSWARVATHGAQVALRFYSRLFLLAPETRELFPLGMEAQRDRLVTALGHTVSHVDDLDRLAPYLRQLGRDHRRVGVVVEHYGPVGDALLATLADFLGPDWTPALAHAWSEAYALVAGLMIEAAEQAGRHSPPWWAAEVVDHERRAFDIAVVTVRPEEPLAYLAGQSLAVETPYRPRTWRYYSPANAPREDCSIELHVRRVPGGGVSGALVDRAAKGDVLRLGPPVGHRLILPADERADLLLVAGGTGLAPLKALVDEVGRRNVPSQRVTLLLGARRPRELYDLDALRTWEVGAPWLTVTPVLGDVVDAARRHAHGDQRAYLCGNDAFVVAVRDGLAAAGCPADRVHFEGFQGLGGDTYGVIDPGGDTVSEQPTGHGRGRAGRHLRPGAARPPRL